MKRKKHKKAKLGKVDLSKPLIEVLGTEDDPCFGHHLVTDSNCKKCGDSEVCAIITAQKLNAERKKLSKKNTFRDDEEEQIMKDRDKKIARTIRVSRKRKLSDKRIIKKLKRRFNLSEAESKKYLSK